MALIDIGANLAHESFHADLDQVLHRAWDAGLEAIVITGSSAESNRQALELARRHPRRLYSTAGLHPHHANEWTDALAGESADLRYHWLALMAASGVSLDAVAEKLGAREGTSGIAEKASRKG